MSRDNMDPETAELCDAVRALETDQLRMVITELYDEDAKRRTAEEAPKRVEEANREYAEAIGRKEGDAWVQPLGAHDAYRKEAVVEHEGSTWTSTVDFNTWEPGVSGWRKQAEDGGVAEWIQPSGTHDAYALGDVVKHNGIIWESIHPTANTWEPGVYGWKEVEETEPPAGEDTAPAEESEEESEEEIPEWKRPLGAHDAYSVKGEKVRHNGDVWENSHGSGNTWEPGAYGWTKVV